MLIIKGVIICCTFCLGVMFGAVWCTIGGVDGDNK